jgi:ParB family chromosome partitioning protein
VPRARRTLEDLKAAAVVHRPVDDRPSDQIQLKRIRESPRNPRLKIDGLDELSASLQEYGLLQPVVVRSVGGGVYELIAGHRRLAAAQQLGWTQIAAVVRDETEDQAYLLTLTENLQREDLTPKEEASALEVLVRERGWTTRQVGEAIKRSHAYVSRRLRVFEDPVLAPLVLERKLLVSTAEELLQAPDPQTRQDLATQAAEHDWTSIEARKAISEIGTVRTKVVELLAQLRRVVAGATQIEPQTLTSAERKQIRQARAALGRLL